jgi:hypothetical protein
VQCRQRAGIGERVEQCHFMRPARRTERARTRWPFSLCRSIRRSRSKEFLSSARKTSDAGHAPRIAVTSATSKAQRFVRGQSMLSSRHPKKFPPRHRSLAFHRTRERWGDSPSIAQCALPHIAKRADLAFRRRADVPLSSRPSHVCNIADAHSKTCFCRLNRSIFDRSIRQTIASQWS